MKKIIRLTESDLVRIVKRTINERKELFLLEQFGQIAKKALGWVSKNEDEIATLFKTTEVALAKSIDDIIEGAIKSKSITPIDDIQKKLMHYYNPSGIAENVPKAQQQMKNFLNGYSKSKGMKSWNDVRNSVNGKPSPNVGQSSAKSAYGAVKDMFKGQRISNRWYGFTNPEYSKFIEWDKITNAKNMDDYNKIIAKAIKTNNYSHISSKGFEKFGIDNFRDYLKNNISKVNEVDPTTGRWSVIFK